MLGLRLQNMSEIILTDRQTDRQTDRRDCSIDLIRVIACVAVVGLHTFPKDLSLVTASLYYLCGFAVPFFFMSSGYFLLNRGELNYKYAGHKCVRIIKIVFFWNCILYVIKLGKALALDKIFSIKLLAFVKEFLKSFVQKGAMWQFWYLGALLIIYLLLPFLSKLNQHSKRVVLLICGIISIAIQIASFQCGKPMQKYVTQTFRIWTWLFYFLLGAEMKTLKVWISNHISVVFHLLLCMEITILIIVFENYVGCKRILEMSGTLHAEYFYDSLYEMLWIGLIFSFLLRINFSETVSKYITGLASLTMGIYIVHPMIRKITVIIIGNTSIFRSIAYWLVTTLCAAIITWIIKRLPFGKFFLRI